VTPVSSDAVGPAEGPAGVVVVVVGVSSSPPIMTAAREEEHTTIRPTPANIGTADIFFFTLYSEIIQ